MNYFVAWNHWHTVTIKDAQKRAGERIQGAKEAAQGVQEEDGRARGRRSGSR